MCWKLCQCHHLLLLQIILCVKSKAALLVGLNRWRHMSYHDTSYDTPWTEKEHFFIISTETSNKSGINKIETFNSNSFYHIFLFSKLFSTHCKPSFSLLSSLFLLWSCAAWRWRWTWRRFLQISLQPKKQLANALQNERKRQEKKGQETPQRVSWQKRKNTFVQHMETSPIKTLSAKVAPRRGRMPSPTLQTQQVSESGLHVVDSFLVFWLSFFIFYFSFSRKVQNIRGGWDSRSQCGSSVRGQGECPGRGHGGRNKWQQHRVRNHLGPDRRRTSKWAFGGARESKSSALSAWLYVVWKAVKHVFASQSLLCKDMLQSDTSVCLNIQRALQ